MVEPCRRGGGAGWWQLGAGIGATLALQGVLFAACLQAAGAHAPLPVALAGFTISRALTLVVLTPNGIEVSGTGTAAVLVALGVAAAPAVATVLRAGRGGVGGRTSCRAASSGSARPVRSAARR